MRQSTHSGCHTPAGQLPSVHLAGWSPTSPGTHDDLQLAGELYSRRRISASVCLFGCLSDEDKYVTHNLWEVVDSIVADARKTVGVLARD